MFVFAYGSNMCVERMVGRVSTAVPTLTGYVMHRELLFHKRSKDGSAKANAAFSRTRDDRVYGVAYRLARHQKTVLDRFEFLGVGYDEECVEVHHDDGILPASMYIARPNAIDDSLRPYKWYHEFVVHGARQHGLPDFYIEKLVTVESIKDPDSERRRENQRLIRAVRPAGE